MSLEITAVKLSTTGNTHEHIVEVMWTANSGVNQSSGTSTRQVMVDFIDAKNAVHVKDGAMEVPVGAVHRTSGAAYIRTYADGEWTNNLLSLPRF